MEKLRNEVWTVGQYEAEDPIITAHGSKAAFDNAVMQFASILAWFSLHKGNRVCIIVSDVSDACDFSPSSASDIFGDAQQATSQSVRANNFERFFWAFDGVAES